MGESNGFSSIEDGLAVLGTALSAADSLIHGEYPKLSGNTLLKFGRSLETLSRKVRAAQVRLVDEIDHQGLAATQSCTSTRTLLREALTIPIGEADARVREARATRPQALPSGGETPAVLPVLGAAVTAGLVDPDHARTLIATMKRLPDRLDPDSIAEAEQTLVGSAPGCARRPT